MIASFRRLSKSKVGTAVLVLVGIVIAASFVFADLSNFGVGGGGNGGATVAEVGGTSLSEREISDELQRRLNIVRQQNPEATLADLANDYEAIVANLIDRLALKEFADDHGFVLSKRLVDAEIANLPGTKGLDGKFSEQAYAQFLSQQRLTDAELRRLIGQELLQQMMLQPVVASARVPVGVATPYASMLLEQRQGEVGLVPTGLFAAGLKPTDADLQRYYAANRTRYMVPEQRVLRMARIGPGLVANIAATDQEIAAEYRRNQATYGARSVRVLSQVVSPNRAVATAVAAAAKGNGNLQAAAQGKADAAYSSLGEQTREQLAGLAGPQVAAAVFSGAKGGIVGPVQSDFGWHVVKIEDVREQPGKSLAEARAEIAARLTENKRKDALTDLVSKVDDAIGDNANFQEAAAAGGLQVTQTPLITADGASRADPNFKLPPELLAVVQQGFQLQPDEDPEVVQVPGTEENVLIAPAQVVPAAPSPLASIRTRVAADWVQQQANSRARTVANAIVAKAGPGTPLAQAIREAGSSLPAPRPVAARRMDLSQGGGQVPAPIRMLFSLGQGKSRVVADPSGGGFAVVRLNRIVPGNAMLQPGLIAQVQRDFQQPLAAETAQEFLSAVRKEVGVKRNEKAMAEVRQRLLGGS